MPNTTSHTASSTLVIQSHRSPLPYAWIEFCLLSVRRWCEFNEFEYRFINDELFGFVPGDLQEKVKAQRVIATDLARLNAVQDTLDSGYETVVWLDADFLIFDPDNFMMPDESYAVGREVWVQENEKGRLKAYKKVHNAFLMFRKQNPFLSFYRNTAERLLRQNQGSMPAQFIGPKLLTALHNAAQLSVMESAGMLSPLVIKDILQGNGKALGLFIAQSPVPIRGANLCISSCDRKDVSSKEMEKIISTLLENNLLFSSRKLVYSSM